MIATTAWINSRSKRFDMGAIKLQSNVLHNDVIQPILANVDEAKVCGYPGDRERGMFQFQHRDQLREVGGRFFYQIDTFGGMSGAPVLKNNMTAIGIHNYGGCDNSASDLYAEFIDFVNSW